jgi:hypothetical protein
MHDTQLASILSGLPCYLTDHGWNQNGIDEYPYHDLIAKLMLLSVLAGHKPTYRVGAELPNPGDFLVPWSVTPSDPDYKAMLNEHQEYCMSLFKRLRRVARTIGLKSVQTVLPPLNTVESNIIPDDIVSSHSLRIFFGKALWVYRNNQIDKQIKKCVQNAMSEGELLGYPKCCTRWQSQIRTRFLEEAFTYFIVTEKDIPSDRNLLRDRAIDFLYGSAESYPGAQMIHKYVDNNLLRTIEMYPFVPHWACPACLKNESDSTAIDNAKFSIFAKKVDEKLYERIIHESKRYAEAIRAADNSTNVVHTL